MTENTTSLSGEQGNNATKGHVVKSFSIGRTRVKICDDCCRRDPTEVNAILEHIARQALEAYAAKVSRKK